MAKTISLPAAIQEQPEPAHVKPGFAVCDICRLTGPTANDMANGMAKDMAKEATGDTVHDIAKDADSNAANVAEFASPLLACSQPSCGRLYHGSCLERGASLGCWKLRWARAPRAKSCGQTAQDAAPAPPTRVLVCPRHVCSACGDKCSSKRSSKRSAKLLVCRTCPTAYHPACVSPACRMELGGGLYCNRHNPCSQEEEQGETCPRGDAGSGGGSAGEDEGEAPGTVARCFAALAASLVGWSREEFALPSWLVEEAPALMGGEDRGSEGVPGVAAREAAPAPVAAAPQPSKYVHISRNIYLGATRKRRKAHVGVAEVSDGEGCRCAARSTPVLAAGHGSEARALAPSAASAIATTTEATTTPIATPSAAATTTEATTSTTAGEASTSTAAAATAAACVDCICSAMFEFCDDACDCKGACSNVPFHRRGLPAMDVFYTGSRGFGVRAGEDISGGTFVVEYTGEVLDPKRCEARLWQMKAAGSTNFYLMEVSAEQIIDAGRKGNVARFLNHSCAPNCRLEKWQDRTTGDTSVAIFASMDIRRGAELCYDYNFQHYGRSEACLCGSAGCRGQLGTSKAGESLDTRSCSPPLVESPLAGMAGLKKKRIRKPLAAVCALPVVPLSLPALDSSHVACKPETEEANKNVTSVPSEDRMRVAATQPTCAAMEAMVHTSTAPAPAGIYACVGVELDKASPKKRFIQTSLPLIWGAVKKPRTIMSTKCLPKMGHGRLLLTEADQQVRPRA